jgi:hypothetical protein
MASGSLSVTVKTPGGTSRPRMAARLRFT